MLSLFTPMPYNQVSPPLMCSLLDQVPESKETQPGSIQPYSARSDEQSVPKPVVEVSCILISSLVFASTCMHTTTLSNKGHSPTTDKTYLHECQSFASVEVLSCISRCPTNCHHFCMFVTNCFTNRRLIARLV